jgi:hypothetical protein
MPSKKGGHRSTPKTYARTPPKKTSVRKAAPRKSTTAGQKAAGVAGAVVHASQHTKLPPPETAKQRAEWEARIRDIKREEAVKRSKQVTSAEEYARRAAARTAAKKTQAAVVAKKGGSSAVSRASARAASAKAGAVAATVEGVKPYLRAYLREKEEAKAAKAKRWVTVPRAAKAGGVTKGKKATGGVAKGKKR